MELPEWVAKHKTKGTEVRFLKGHYYLYSISSKRVKGKKWPQKITGPFLGAITQEGLIPPKKRNGKICSKSIAKEQAESSASAKLPQDTSDSMENIIIKSYGGAVLLKNLSQDFIDALADIFPSNYKELAVLAILRLLYQRPLKNMSHLYQNSYLSELIPHCSLSGGSLSPLLRHIGSQRDKIVTFMQRFVQGAEHVLVDLTHMISQSEKMSMNIPGYNSKMDFKDQINLLYIYSVDKQSPAYYRILPGNIRDIAALSLSIKEAHVKSATVICDKGFTSKSNIEELEKNELTYICPLKRNHSLVDVASLKKSAEHENYSGHFLFSNKVIWYTDRIIEEHNKQTDSTSKRRVITYVDNFLKANEGKDYLIRVTNKVKGYTEKAYFRKQHTFGTLTFITNMIDVTPEKIYSLYKGRCQIEEYFDTFKNLLDADRTYMQNDQSCEAWVFINHIAMMISSKLYAILREKDLLKKYSLQDFLIHLNSIQKIKIQEKWYTGEITKKTKGLMDSLGISEL